MKTIIAEKFGFIVTDLQSTRAQSHNVKDFFLVQQINKETINLTRTVRGQLPLSQSVMVTHQSSSQSFTLSAM